MKNLCIIYDDYCLRHEADFYHAERPERASAIIEYLEKNNFIKKVDFFKPEEASKEMITAVHSEEHFKRVKDAVEKRKQMLDPDTYINDASWKAALLAAGSAVTAVDCVLDKGYRRAFSLMRPPGHHAESNRAMGFCLFNNIAIGAAYAMNKYGKKRVAIIDWDVHHGNGTQEIFYESSDVLFISLHQHPLYPGTGFISEAGKGAGKGYTINYPLPPNTKGATYIKLFEEEIIKHLTGYKPEILFISAGFDAHQDDPLASMMLSSSDFSILTKILNKFAGSLNIPIVSVLEGGYNIEALSESVYEHLKKLNTK